MQPRAYRHLLTKVFGDRFLQSNIQSEMVDKNSFNDGFHSQDSHSAFRVSSRISAAGLRGYDEMNDDELFDEIANHGELVGTSHQSMDNIHANDGNLSHGLSLTNQSGNELTTIASSESAVREIDTIKNVILQCDDGEL